MGYQPLLNRPPNPALDIRVWRRKPKRSKGCPKQDHPATFAASLRGSEDPRYPLKTIDIRTILQHDDAKRILREKPIE